jgi:type II secretory pathway component PulF
MTILLQGVAACGERVYRLFPSKSQLQIELIKQSISTIKTKTICAKRELNDTFWLDFFSTLKNNLIAYQTIADALTPLCQQTKKPLACAIFNEVKQYIHAGKPLSIALKQLTVPIATHYIALISQGENNQCLLDALQQIINDIQIRLQYKKQWRKKLTYPCLLLCFTWGFLHFMLWVLLPNIQLLYQSIGKPTTALTHLTHWQTGLLCLDGLLVIAVAARHRAVFIHSNHKLRQWFCHIPYWRNWLLLTHRLRWLQIFNLQYTITTPLLDALKQAHQHCTHPALRQASAQLITAVEQGKAPSHVMQQHAIFPSAWSAAFALGEKDNQLSLHCQHLANQEQADFSSRADRLLASMEPIVLASLAGLILLLILALYKPLLGLYGNYT